jgi:hypothetical protein
MKNSTTEMVLQHVLFKLYYTCIASFYTLDAQVSRYTGFVNMPMDDTTSSAL